LLLKTWLLAGFRSIIILVFTNLLLKLKRIIFIIRSKFAFSITLFPSQRRGGPFRA
jgi:hypothetical protein